MTFVDPGSSLGALAPQQPRARWDKLTICNEALANTANNTVTTADDGSDEWRIASIAYDRWVKVMMYRRDWKFATLISPPLARVGSSPFPGYGDVYAKPADCLYLVDVWRADLASLIIPAILGAPSDQYNTQPPPLDYKIIGDQIHTTACNPVAGNVQTVTADDFTPDVDSDLGGANETITSDLTGIICQYVPYPSDQQPWSVGFVEALRLKIEAGCFRALNEDFSEANRCDKEAEMALAEASSRNDSEEPRRVAFRSRLNERRRVGRYGAGICW